MSLFFAPGGQRNRVWASTLVLQMNIQDWFPLGWIGWISLQSKGLSSLLQHHGSKASILLCSAFFIVKLSHPYMTTGKTIAWLDDPADVGNLISGSSAFSKTSLNIREFTVHILLKPGLENFEHYFASMWDECNCVVVGAFLGIAFRWNWNENWPFPVLWPLLSFPYLLAYWALIAQF